jgi:alpha-aminoadipate/glutamate carrier protein LysW
MISCPKCDAPIDVDEEDLDEGDLLSCDECGASLSVTGVKPVELKSADEDDDKDDAFDFDDDDDDDEDDEEEESEDEEWH